MKFLTYRETQGIIETGGGTLKTLMVYLNIQQLHPRHNTHFFWKKQAGNASLFATKERSQ